MVDIKQARQALHRLCRGEGRMCVPAQADDDDMILSAALDELERLRNQVEGVKTKAFCYSCREESHYTVKELNEITVFNGKEIEFVSHHAYCDQCGGEVYVAELEDENLQAFNEAYRKKSSDDAMNR